METSFDSLVYESDISESSGSVKSTKSRAGRKKRSSSIGSTQSQPVRRSQRISMLPKVKIEASSYDDDDENMYKDMPLLDGENSNLSNAKLEHATEDIKILGATEVNGNLHFIYKRNGEDKPQVMSNDEAKSKYPYPLMDFYESCMVWDVSEDELQDAERSDGANGTDDK